MSDWQRFVSRPDLDIMSSKPGLGVTFVTDADQVEALRSEGYRIVVEIEDMEAFYASRIRGPNFGQFHTYSEMEDFLDALHAQYPSITTSRISIGTSIEGRTIWAFKISDNPDLDEDEPEILFDGMHHAREPMSLEAQLHFMEWLTQNHGTDPEATFLVDNREIWFIPIVNPDGFIYNETTNPSGGGMWRKNRRDNPGSSCKGVDLNRNYPYQWGKVGRGGVVLRPVQRDVPRRVGGLGARGPGLHGLRRGARAHREHHVPLGRRHGPVPLELHQLAHAR